MPAILASALLAAPVHAAVIYNEGPAAEPTDSVVLELPDGRKLEFYVERNGNSPFLSAFVTADGVRVLKESALDLDALIDAQSGPFVERLNLYKVRDSGKADGDQIAWESRVRQLRAQVFVFVRAHFQKCHYNSANCSGAAGLSIPNA
ncbi:hypothetical protein [Thauera phenolivorans]|uniref:hypothetical protein n=1 Tax=Thauera phenolivorans TaxID=1792543 RepID=UPI001E46A9B8|nr:hypothetical protein [Thauera phenolivorans]